ncbi:uncharacterized protein MELLADRAFT_93401 [Melampsora larici-populina 98AG31]|uniref:Uncharacterized protein n=1 Tax=Melampsora larici-populina (strain 98AG31 / pathotype 3-4-7) TaxID=747676 RepID=F4RA93_MELLP|nr:uncharacterized protein MELLADRAFT_93401 [Melampsora larici-populina 98AG31]EGG10819.1 hypothetical protein MELLADRAFT_93401 [Melampsora larici-populina 98AG31]
MKNHFRHSQTPKHLEAVARFEAHVAAQHAILPGINAGNPPSPAATNHQLELLDDETSNHDSDPPERPPTPISYLRALEMAEITYASSDEDSDLEADVHKIAEAFWAMEAEDGARDDELLDDTALETHARAVPESSEWYPFKRKEVSPTIGLASSGGV